VSLSTDADSSEETPNLLSPRRHLLFVGRRGLVASTASTAVVLVVIIAFLYFAPGGVRVRASYFNFHDMWVAWNGDPSKGILAIRDGIWTNVWMFLVSEVLVLLFGLALAWTRISKSAVLLPFRVLATAYSDIFRGVPVLLVMFLVGFGLPALYSNLATVPPPVFGVITLTLSYSAYVSEVFRAGILSVPNGQLLAARSLGLTQSSTMRRVILPQAVRTVIPPLLNDFISLQKDTVLVSVIGGVEIARSAQIYQSTVFNESGLVLAAAFFLLLTVPMTRMTDLLIARDRERRLAAAR
jgi:polar amino acid transport system permease protein